MAEEIIRQIRNWCELYEAVQEIYPSLDDLRRRSLPGNEAFLVQEGEEEELRQYRLVDADGNEIKWPLKLISNTRIVI